MSEKISVDDRFKTGDFVLVRGKTRLCAAIVTASRSSYDDGRWTVVRKLRGSGLTHAMPVLPSNLERMPDEHMDRFRLRKACSEVAP